MDYIVPGIILMSVISHSYANVVSSFYSTKFQRNIEELLVAPIPLGHSGRLCQRRHYPRMLVGVVVALISLLFTDITVNNIAITLSIAALTATVFSLAGFINAILAESFDDISIIPNFVLTPLSYLGGVFYSVNMLPDFWQIISKGNPILYMINAFRYGLIGVTDVDIQMTFIITGGFIITLTYSAFIFYIKVLGLRINRLAVSPKE